MARAKTMATPEEKLAAALVPAEEQPYAVPENWCWVRAGGVCDFIGGGTPDKSNPGYWGGDIPWASIKDIKGDRLTGTVDAITEDGLNCSAANMCHVGELILATRINPGDTIIANIDTAVNQDLKIVRSEISAEFLHLAFEVMKPRLLQQTSGSTVKGLKLATVKALPLPLPPLAEQKRIVERVELLFAKLDKAANVLSNLICNSDERQAAILRDAFDGSLTARWRREHQVSRAEWIENTIGNCCKVGSGGTPSRKNPSNYVGDIPWIKTGEIDWNHIRETEEHISQKAVETSSAKLYQPGAVLVAMYGMGQTRGKAALLDIAATTNQAVCVLEPDSSLNREFLFRFFQRNYWAVRELSFGGNQLNLSATVIKGLKINLPTLEEQQEITSSLTRLFDAEQKTVFHARNALERIQEVKASILARALRGELGTNDPIEVGVFKSHHEQ